MNLILAILSMLGLLVMVIVFAIIVNAQANYDPKKELTEEQLEYLRDDIRLTTKLFDVEDDNESK